MVAATKEHLKRLIDALPDEAAVELERVIVSFLARPEAEDWFRFSSALYNAWFTGDEYLYPDSPAKPQQ